VPNNPKTNFAGAQRFIEWKRTHGQESLSGPGSWLSNAQATIRFVGDVVRQNPIRSILDLGCGDWNWFRKVEIVDVAYLGWDADAEMIRANREAFGNERVDFAVKDIASEEYPSVDLIICRDVLFHMEMDLAQRVIAKARQRCRYFVATSFPQVPRNTGPSRYTDFDDWGFYPINLNIAPFHLAAFAIEQRAEGMRIEEYERFVCLYQF
jgi:SAM-dependent methyltransferase